MIESSSPRKPELVQDNSFAEIFFRRDVFRQRDDGELFDTIVELLKLKRLYREGLVYSVFDGLPVYVMHSFGERSKTFGATEEDLRQSLPEVRDRDAVASLNPLRYLADADRGMPALGVFDADKLAPVGDRTLWRTIGGASLDGAAVAVFFFRTESDEYYRQQFDRMIVDGTFPIE